MVAKLFIFSVLFGMSYAAVWIGRLPAKPKEFANKEGCYVKEVNDVIPFGETIYPIGYCYRITCDTQMIDYASCGVVGTDDAACHIVEEDYSKPYPLCCKTVKCDLDNKID